MKRTIRYGYHFMLLALFFCLACDLNMTYNRPVKSLSVSDFKAHLSAYLRNVQHGETYVITEHRRPVAEVRQSGSEAALVDYPPEPFSLNGIDSEARIGGHPGLGLALINEDRGE